MTKDIYLLLINHFNQTASVEGEKLIAQYKKENLMEYEQLKKLWTSKGKISIHDFDTDAAWTKVVRQVRPSGANIIPFYSKKIMRYAAAVAVLIMSSIFGYYYLNDTSPVPIAQIVSTKSGELVVLNDGSKVWLNNNTSLTYPERFGRSNRTVTLNGEAFFEVEKNPEKPFIIKTQNAETKVLGTSFNVNSNEQTTEVMVTTGRVEVSSSNNEKVVVTPGYTAKVQSETLSSFATTNLNYLSWKTGEFTFNETELTKVVADLNAYHNGQIRLENDLITNCKITADFDAVPLSEIMEMIELTCDVTINKLNDKYLIQ